MSLDVSIVIPVKNGGARFAEVLATVFAQETKYKYEVICIDSGSSDSTLETIAGHDCRLIAVDPSDFGHGKTRTLGASAGSGEFIVFLTHDAKPATNDWLQNFIDAMKSDPEIAGGYGKHLPYPEADIFTKRDLVRHFANMGEENRVYQLREEERERYEEEPLYRAELGFFSDNNACVRRSVFEKHPYRDVDFAEDQVWANEIISLGMKKLYCPSAAVYHSHNTDKEEAKIRAFEEHKALYSIYGYRIAENIGELKDKLFRQNAGDMRYALKSELPFFDRIGTAISIRAKNKAKFEGAFDGGHYADMSEEIQEKANRRYSRSAQRKRRT